MATQSVADSRADHARGQKRVALGAGRVWSALSRRRQCSRVGALRQMRRRRLRAAGRRFAAGACQRAASNRAAADPPREPHHLGHRPRLARIRERAATLVARDRGDHRDQVTRPLVRGCGSDGVTLVHPPGSRQSLRTGVSSASRKAGRRPVRARNPQSNAPDCSLARGFPVRASNPPLAATVWLLEQVTHGDGPQTAGSARTPPSCLSARSVVCGKADSAFGDQDPARASRAGSPTVHST